MYSRFFLLLLSVNTIYSCDDQITYMIKVFKRGKTLYEGLVEKELAYKNAVVINETAQAGEHVSESNIFKSIYLPLENQELPVSEHYVSLYAMLMQTYRIRFEQLLKKPVDSFLDVYSSFVVLEPIIKAIDEMDNEVKKIDSWQKIGDCLHKVSFLFSLKQKIDNNIPLHDLKHLTCLTIEHSDLQEVPAQIGQLVNIQELELSYNNLQSLPNTFKNLIKLKKLVLVNNKFTRIPPVAQYFKSLTYLNVSFNEIKLTHQPFVHIKNLSLKEIEFDRNGMSFFPDEIYDIKTLVMLSACNTAMYFLFAYKFFNMTNLKSIKISESSVRLFPADILKKLKEKFDGNVLKQQFDNQYVPMNI